MRFKKIKLLKEQFTDKEIVDFLKSYFGTVEKPYSGPTYILPDGYMLNILECKHHSEVEKVLIDNGYSNDIYVVTGGSPTMRKLDAIRCDTVKYYVDLPDEQLTRQQYNTLLVWLDYLSYQTRMVTVCANNGSISTDYRFNETITDDIINRIRRYYMSGRLYEHHEVKHTRQYNAKFLRKPFGEELNEFDESTITESALRESKNKYIQ